MLIVSHEKRGMGRSTYPPDILANSTAAYLYRPARKVVMIQDKIQTAMNDLDDSAAEEDVAGMRRTRRVERWTLKCAIINIYLQIKM